MIKQLLNSIFAKFIFVGVSIEARRSIICLSLRFWQMIDLLTHDKSRYFDPPLPNILSICAFSRVSVLYGTEMLISLTLFPWLRLLRLRLQNQVNPQGFLFFPRFSISSLRSRISLSSSWERSEAWVWREACRRSATLSAVRRRSDVFIVSVFLTHLMCINVCSCNTVKWIQFITS